MEKKKDRLKQERQQSEKSARGKKNSELKYKIKI